MIILNYDNWDDYHYKTLFGMYYCDNNKDVHEIGSVKIYYWLHDEDRANNFSKHTRETLKEQIDELDSNYCSLGQKLSYYKNLKTMLPEECIDILKRLRDIAVFPEIKKEFIDEKGVGISLLRFSSAEKALNEAYGIIYDQVQSSKDISFKYRATVPYDCTPVTLNFDFRQNDIFPYRINVLIGKNGTGKTQILSRLANSLSGFTDEQESSQFVEQRPPIDKVMSISYSAFDCFKKPPKSADKDRENKRTVFSYVYCGIQSEHGTLSLAELRDNLIKSYKRVKERDRLGIWHHVLAQLMEAEHRQTVQLISEERFHEINLSSGQHILICTITELIANIEKESIILFDEPEIHLHPNAIANVMRMFYELLEQFNSYAIFSTHSPIILQEIPSRYIQILDRVDDLLTVRQPDIECFGNNISDIILDVFDVSSRESNYKTIFDSLCKKYTYQKICDKFEDRLSLHALIYLKNCYKEMENI